MTDASLTQEERAKLRAFGLTDDDIDNKLKIRSGEVEKVEKILRELAAEKAQKKSNGGGGAGLEPPLEQPEPASKPQPEPDRAAPEVAEANPDTHEEIIPAQPEPDRDQLEAAPARSEAAGAGMQNESVTFLEKLRPGGPSVPDGATATVTPRTTDQIEIFIRQHNVKRNLYYSVNPTRTAMNKKAAKTDILAIEYIHFDGDPRDDETPEQAKARYLKAIEQFTEETGIKFTFGIDSGNGIQGLCRLRERIALGEPIATVDEKGKPKLVFSPEDQAKIDDVEARILALTLRLGGDAGTQNIDRILRLPGTTNLPNAKKRKAGARSVRPGCCGSTIRAIRSMRFR